MKKLAIFPGIVALCFAGPAFAQTPKAPTDAVSKMFTWWDAAFKTPGAFTPENFAKHFTPDATLTLEGKTVIHGLAEWASHFQKIQASGRAVEIVVPFKDVFEKDGQIYTYHVIRSRKDGVASCSLAAGHAVMRGAKIASITLVRQSIDPALDAQCWQN